MSSEQQHQIDDLIATYLEAIAVEGKTPKTIASYANSLQDLRRVGRRLGHPEDVRDYTCTHVYAFLTALRERGASPDYQHRRHREVRACFSWLKRMGYVEENVFGRVPLVKRPQRLQPPFSAEEVRTLLRSQNQGSYTGSRNYALILFLLDTGVRASECVGLGLEDIDWPEKRARIRHGKGEKERWVAFGTRAHDALRAYVEEHRGWQPGALFMSRHGKEGLSTAHSLNVILTRLGARAGVKGVHPHRFRHTFATWAIESGAREIDVQMLLGHSDLTMTQRYARTYTSEQAIRAHPHLSPVLRLAS